MTALALRCDAMNEYASKLAEVVKSFRKEQKLSLRKFAERVGVSHATIDKIESGVTTNPQDAILEALANVMPYTYVELKLIAQGMESEDTRTYVTAEEVLEVARTIERDQQVRLIHLLLDDLSGQ